MPNSAVFGKLEAKLITGVDEATGWNWIGDSTIRGFVGGTEQVRVSSAGLGMKAGTAAAPSLHGASDADTGFAWLGSNVLLASVGGSGLVHLSATGMRLAAGASTAASYLLHVAASGASAALTVDGTTGAVGINAVPISGVALKVVGYSRFEQTGTGGQRCIQLNNAQAVATGVGSLIEYIASGGVQQAQIAANWSAGATTASYMTLRVRDSDAITPMMWLSGVGCHISNNVATAAATTALLELTSTTQGFLPPRMTTTQRDNISTPAEGLVIYNTTTGKLNVKGASAWEAVTSA